MLIAAPNITKPKRLSVSLGGILSILTIVCFPFFVQASTEKASLQQEVEAFDQHFNGLTHWLLSVYDAETGGFWESIEEKQQWFNIPFFWQERKPRLESTARAVNIMYAMGCLDDLTPEVRQKLVAYIQHFQTKEGWFDDPQEKRKFKSRLGRGLVYGTATLKKLGAEPLYPIPTQNDNSSIVYLSHLESRENLRAWFEKVSAKKDAWTAGSAIQDLYVLIRGLPPEKQASLFSELFALFESTQLEDGYWWQGKPYDRLTGSYKISTYYQKLNRPMPRASIIFETTLRVMRNEPVDNASVNRNAITFLNTVKPQIESHITHQQRLEAVTIIIKNTALFKRADGGFAHSPSDQWGGTDGASHAVKSRLQLRIFAGLDSKPLANGRQLSNGLQAILSASK